MDLFNIQFIFGVFMRKKMVSFLLSAAILILNQPALLQAKNTKNKTSSDQELLK